MITKVKCLAEDCSNVFEQQIRGYPKEFCSKQCRHRNYMRAQRNRAHRCYCYAWLVDGKCPHHCPVEASPQWLLEQDRKVAAREEYARRQERLDITAEDMRRVSRAVAKFDPTFARISHHGRRAMRHRSSQSRRVIADNGSEA